MISFIFVVLLLMTTDVCWCFLGGPQSTHTTHTRHNQNTQPLFTPYLQRAIHTRSLIHKGGSRPSPTQKMSFANMFSDSADRVPDKEWILDDSLVEFLRNVVKDKANVNWDGLETCLDKHSIWTIGEFKKAGDDEQDEIFDYFNRRDMLQVTLKLDRVTAFVSAEEILHRQKFINQDGRRLEESFTGERYFSEDAISVKESVQTTRGGCDIRIVLGPSGSGKTVYALNHLAQKDVDDNDKKSVCIYYSLSHVSPRDFAKTEASASQEEANRKSLHPGHLPSLTKTSGTSTGITSASNLPASMAAAAFMCDL